MSGLSAKTLTAEKATKNANALAIKLFIPILPKCDTVETGIEYGRPIT
jgi:hypothetical protein